MILRPMANSVNMQNNEQNNEQNNKEGGGLGPIGKVGDDTIYVEGSHPSTCRAGCRGPVHSNRGMSLTGAVLSTVRPRCSIG